MPAGFTNHWADRGDDGAVPSFSWYSAAVPAAASDAAVSCADFRPAVTAAMSRGSSAAESRTRYQSSYASPPSLAHGAPAIACENDRTNPALGDAQSAGFVR